jgi:hypothetical protein
MTGAIARLVSSTTLIFASRGSQVQSRATTISDHDMAWLLVDAAPSCLTGYERTKVFVELGCGKGYLAITRILSAILFNQMSLPVTVLSRLARWLNGYAGSPEEPRLRMMLAVIRLQQYEGA